MAQVGLDIFLSGYAGDLIVVWRKANTVPEVGRSAALPFPVDTDITGKVVAPNLSPEVYDFEFWQSSDGVALDTLIRGPWSIDASAYNGGIAKKYEYVVDRGNTGGVIGNGDYWVDPASGQQDIVDERYAGVAKDDIKVEMRGTGFRRTDEWDVRAGGGITITAVDPGSGVPEELAPQDSILVTVFQKTSTAPSPTTSSDYADVKIVNADAAVDATFKNKLIVCTGANPVTTLTFPAHAAMADQKMKINTNAMAGNYLKLQFDGADTIALAGNRNVVYLTKGRMIEIMWKSGAAYVMSEISASGYDVRGKREFADDVKDHQLKRDGEIRDIDDFPGIVEWIQTLPGASVVTSRASWDTDANRHKYYLNVGANEFSLPDDQDMHARALKTFDGTNGTPGVYQKDLLKDHQHEQTIGQLPTSVFGRGTVSRKKGNYDKQQDGTTDITGPPCTNDGTIVEVGSETAVKAYRQYAVLNL